MIAPAPAAVKPVHVHTVSLIGSTDADVYVFATREAADAFQADMAFKTFREVNRLAVPASWSVDAIRANFSRQLGMDVVVHDLTETDPMDAEYESAHDWPELAEVDEYVWEPIETSPNHAEHAECVAWDLPGSEFTEPRLPIDEEGIDPAEYGSYLRMIGGFECEWPHEHLIEQQELAEFGSQIGHFGY